MREWQEGKVVHRIVVLSLPKYGKNDKRKKKRINERGNDKGKVLTLMFNKIFVFEVF
jgi:hypothetical protein